MARRFSPRCERRRRDRIKRRRVPTDCGANNLLRRGVIGLGASFDFGTEFWGGLAEAGTSVGLAWHGMAIRRASSKINTMIENVDVSVHGMWSGRKTVLPSADDRSKAFDRP